MISGIETTGFDELESLVQEMTVTDLDERKAMKAAIEIPYEATQKVTPVRTNTMKKSEVMQVKKEDFATVGIVRYGVFWDIFNEFGTSKDKRNVGFFERAINGSQDETLNVLAQILLSKAV